MASYIVQGCNFLNLLRTSYYAFSAAKNGYQNYQEGKITEVALDALSFLALVGDSITNPVAFGNPKLNCTFKVVAGGTEVVKQIHVEGFDNRVAIVSLLQGVSVLRGVAMDYPEIFGDHQLKARELIELLDGCGDLYHNWDSVLRAPNNALAVLAGISGQMPQQMQSEGGVTDSESHSTGGNSEVRSGANLPSGAVSSKSVPYEAFVKNLSNDATDLNRYIAFQERIIKEQRVRVEGIEKKIDNLQNPDELLEPIDGFPFVCKITNKPVREACRPLKPDDELDESVLYERKTIAHLIESGGNTPESWPHGVAFSLNSIKPCKATQFHINKVLDERKKWLKQILLPQKEELSSLERDLKQLELKAGAIGISSDKSLPSNPSDSSGETVRRQNVAAPGRDQHEFSIVIQEFQKRYPHGVYQRKKPAIEQERFSDSRPPVAPRNKGKSSANTSIHFSEKRVEEDRGISAIEQELAAKHSTLAAKVIKNSE